MMFREALGAELRSQRLAQGRTLRDISMAACVSLGYLSEVERGQKEASSEMLAAICSALEVRLSDVLWALVDRIRATEPGTGQHGADGTIERVAA